MSGIMVSLFDLTTVDRWCESNQKLSNWYLLLLH